MTHDAQPHDDPAHRRHDAQKHYADDTRRRLEAHLAGEKIEQDHLIVDGGEIVSGTYRAIYETPASESYSFR